ncbi:hypothetical protein Pan241w_34800 [Gimesia alba]|uniref:Uncharacterized protein n=1 Tax=Gimesia alba TaxID=2527973 RepID=A0A517RHP3_9PLAN|nr:hypothetical protein Pan241w_34800 [Gimesia alba]
MQREAFRCRLIYEVQGSSDLEKRSETSGFVSAEFLSGTGISTEPVVLAHARDFISA